MSQWRRKGDRCAVVNNVNRILSCHCKENKLDTVCSRTPFFSQKSRLKFERCQFVYSSYQFFRETSFFK